MNSALKSWLSVLAMISIIAGSAIVLLGGIPVFAENASSHPDVIDPRQSVFGLTYGEWAVKWWQHVLAIPGGTNPVNDPDGAFCNLGQSSGPVFFLAGASGPVTRSCTVPAGKTIVFPIINVECSTVEESPFFGNNGQELNSCAAAIIDAVGIETLKVSIDENKVKDLTPFRMQSPLFNFSMPADDNFLNVTGGVTSGSSVSDGYWIIVKPLSPGPHVIHFEGAVTSGPFNGYSQNVTYELTVQ